jgi:hypothetical protein
VRQAFLAAALLCAGAAAKDREAADLVREFDSIRIPWGLDVPEEEYEALVRERCGRQCEIAQEVCARFPDHPRAPKLAAARWTLLLTVFDDPARVLAETADAPPRLRREATFARAHATLESAEATIGEKLRRVREVTDGDAREDVAFLLLELAKNHVPGPAKQREILEKVAGAWPGTEAERAARAQLRGLANVGTRFDLDLGEPILGAKGGDAERTIVHIWSTWATRDRKDLAALRRIGGVRVWSVVAGEGEEPVARARRLVGDVPGNWAVFVRADDGWWDRMGLDGWPAFLLLDREGKVLAVTGRPEPLARYGTG